MKVLLVYELIPEETRFFIFDNVNPSSELYKNLLDAHGHYSNYEGESGDNAGTEFLNEYLAGNKGIGVKELLNAGPFDAVFHSGFGL